MTRTISLRTAILALLTTATAALALGALPADAGQPGARAQRPGMAQQRNVVERTTTRTRTDNGWSSSTTWTNKDGGTGSSQTTVVRDREAGTRSRETVTNLPSGETRTVNSSGERTDSGFVNNTTISGPQGTMTRSTEIVRSENGRTITTHVTTPSGNEISRTVTITRDPETGEVTKHVERSGPEG